MAKKRKPEDHDLDHKDGQAHGDAAEGSTTSSRRKKPTSSRIGRACDRCQHRKLACDPAPEGCAPCQRVSAWCTVTDPLTQTPTYRGEFEYLEQRVAKQHDDIQELLGRLRSLGEDVSAYQEKETENDKRYNTWRAVKASGDTRPWDRDERQMASSRTAPQQEGASINAPHTAMASGAEAQVPLEASSSDALCLPDVRTGITGHNFLGVLTSKESKSLHPKSKLNILGWEIDLSSIDSYANAEPKDNLENGQPLYDLSYRSFIATMHGLNPKLPKVELPSREETFSYATGYFMVIGAFIPVLHKPTFMSMLSKVYDQPGFQPSAAQEVWLHSILAIMFYQQAARNWEDQKVRAGFNSLAIRHYHYSLGLIPRLLLRHSLHAMQALVMICSFVRAFPQPEVGWWMMSFTFSKLLQLRYHRSAKSEPPSSGDRGFLETELRKRVFWSSLQVLVTASGKMGRPMPLRVEDFDVEIPRAVADEQLTENGLQPANGTTCGFLVANETFKVEPIFMELYNTLYAAKRSTKEYMQYVPNGEKRIKAWCDGWPEEYKPASSPKNSLTRIYSSYLQYINLEFQLLLHHPSLSLSKSLQFNDNNIRICLKVCREMLQVTKFLQKMKSFDTTWISCTVHMLAIQTTLYGHGQLKVEMTEEKLAELKSDMEDWLSIMGDLGGLLGPGPRLQEAVRRQVDSGMAQLEQYIARTKSTPQVSPIKPEAEERHEENGEDNVSVHSVPPQAEKSSGYSTNHGGYHDSAQASNNYQTTNTYQPPNQAQSANDYVTQYPYANASNNNYNGANTGSYTNTYPVNFANEAMHSNYRQPQSTTGTTNGMYEQVPSGYANQGNYLDSSSWIQYTQTIPSDIVPQDYQPASALLQLGGRTAAVSGEMAGMGLETTSMSGGAGHMWPLGLFDPNAAG